MPLKFILCRASVGYILVYMLLCLHVTQLFEAGDDTYLRPGSYHLFLGIVVLFRKWVLDLGMER